MNSPAVLPHEVFALLDDSRSGVAEESVRSRLYTGFQKCIEYHQGQPLSAFFADIDKLFASGLYAIALFHYEFGDQLQQLSSQAPDLPTEQASAHAEADPP